MSYLDQDPHDAMLLTHRPVTVLTQATTLLDSAPDMYGSQEDEESMFAGVASDTDLDSSNGVAQASSTSKMLQKVPGIVPDTISLLRPMSAPAQPAMSMTPIVVVLGLLIGAVWLGGKSGKKS